MKQRLHHALIEASELRAFIVLLFILYRRAWHFLPESIYLYIRYIKQRTSNRMTYYLYHHVHWVGITPFSPVGPLQGIREKGWG